MKKIRVGFIGCGRISDLHALGYHQHAGAEIAAVCDVNEETARRKQNEWNAEYSTTDYRKILHDPDIDAVEILTPQKLHERMTIEACEQGKHVLVQKPMSIDLQSCDRMIQAAEKSGTVLKVMENYIFYPPIRKAKELIDAGTIGIPITMRIKFISGSDGGWDIPLETWEWRMVENAEGRGMQTFDHGFHMWSTAWFLMGEVERVKAWVDSYNSIVDCPSMIMWKYKEQNEAAALDAADIRGKRDIRYGICDYTHAYDLKIPSRYYANDEWMEITGSEGIIKVNRCTGNIQNGPAVSVFTSEGWTDYDDIESDWSAGFIGATENFIASVRGEQRPRLSGQEGREIMKFTLAVQKSSAERREVYLDELDEADGRAFSEKKIAEEISRQASRSALTLEELKNNPRLL